MGTIKFKDLEVGDVYLDKKHKLLCIYVGCARQEDKSFVFATYFTYVVKENVTTYIKKKTVLQFFEKNHRYSADICNSATSNYKVNVLYNVNDALQKYEMKKRMCGYEVADCRNTKEVIRLVLIELPRLRNEYFAKLPLSYY